MILVRWILASLAAVMFLPAVPEARACSPHEPALDRTYPAAGGVLPLGAMLLLDGQVLRPEQLAVTVDDAPAQLVLVLEHSRGLHFFAWGWAYRTMALRVEPPPQLGQTIVITGDPCLQADGMSLCDAVELEYTVGEADDVPPDAPAELWYDVYDQGSVSTGNHSSCGNTSARFEITVHTELMRRVLEYPLAFHLSRRPRHEPGAWELVEHDWIRDEDAHDPSFRWFSLPEAVEGLLPLAEAFCLRLQTFDASENLGGELEVCPPCHDQVGPDDGSFLGWPTGLPSYDDAWRYPDGHCPEALEPDDETGTSGGDSSGTSGGDEGHASSSSGAPESSSSSQGLPGGEQAQDGCGCVATVNGRGRAAVGTLMGLLLLGALRRTSSRHRGRGRARGCA